MQGFLELAFRRDADSRHPFHLEHGVFQLACLLVTTVVSSSTILLEVMICAVVMGMASMEARRQLQKGGGGTGIDCCARAKTRYLTGIPVRTRLKERDSYEPKHQYLVLRRSLTLRLT